MSNPTIEAVRSTFPPFTEFPSIARLFRDVVVTEKIDGTNASVHVLEDGRVLAASRTRYIVPLADNFGFAAWVEKNADQLREGLGVGVHFGEWYGSGIQRGYGLTNGEKRFALFNSGRWWSQQNDQFVLDDTPKMKVPPACCGVVPIIWKGNLDSEAIIEVGEALVEQGSRVVRGFMKPEGIVVYHTAARQSFKYTFDKNDGHKSALKKTELASEPVSRRAHNPESGVQLPGEQLVP